MRTNINIRDCGLLDALNEASWLHPLCVQVQSGNDLVKLAVCHVEGGGASGARELTIRLEPSERLRHFVAAIRAGDRDLDLVGK